MIRQFPENVMLVLTVVSFLRHHSSSDTLNLPSKVVKLQWNRHLINHLSVFSMLHVTSSYLLIWLGRFYKDFSSPTS